MNYHDKLAGFLSDKLSLNVLWKYLVPILDREIFLGN